MAPRMAAVLCFLKFASFGKNKRCSNFKILGCSGRSLALIGGSFAVPKSSLLPGKCFSEPSKIAFLDVGSLRISARRRPEALSGQMRTVRLVGLPLNGPGRKLDGQSVKKKFKNPYASWIWAASGKSLFRVRASLAWIFAFFQKY